MALVRISLKLFFNPAMDRESFVFIYVFGTVLVFTSVILIDLDCFAKALLLHLTSRNSIIQHYMDIQ